MNEKDYPTLYQSVGAFDIFKSQYYKGSYVRALCSKDDNDRVKMISHRLIDLNDEHFTKWTDSTQHHVIRRRNISDKRAKQTYFEVALETQITPAKAAEWLLANAMDIAQINQEKVDFSIDRLSVGPCRYQFADNDKQIQYVKIRFDGYSVPFYFTPGGLWDASATALGVKEEVPNDPGTQTEILKMFETSKTAEMLIKRAMTRPMNKSRIVESGSFSPTFFVPTSIKSVQIVNSGYQGTKSDFEGYKAVKEKNEMAAPGMSPVAVFNFTRQPTKDTYGYNRRNSLVVIVTDDDKIYTTTKIYNWYGSVEYGNRSLNLTTDLRWMGVEAVIKKTDMVPLDKDDEFARERAGRALSRKL